LEITGKIHCKKQLKRKLIEKRIIEKRIIEKRKNRNA
jgi:hypothetical protein